jgi:hypothetical protein
MKPSVLVAVAKGLKEVDLLQAICGEVMTTLVSFGILQF